MADLHLDESTVLRPVFDPRLYQFSAQLWLNGQPAGIHGLIDPFNHPDDLINTIDKFLNDADVRALTEDEKATLGYELIMQKGGPDAALLQLAAEHPEFFIVLDD